MLIQFRFSTSISRIAVLLLLAILFSVFGISAPHTFDIKEFGALGNALQKDTESIQEAIDSAAASGSGTVYFPPGRYLTGTLFMRSGVTLYLEAGAVLLGSTDLADFPPTWPSIRSFTDNYVNRSLIYGEDLNDISVVGSGSIDGQGANYTDTSYLIRPYLIRFVKCRNVLVEGITLQNSPMWVQHYLGCDLVRIAGLTVHSQVNRNNDMLDIDGCKNVLISDCFADTEDDAITLKSTFDGPTENVAVTNCVLSSQCNAIKLGTESNGGFRNITISNCVIDSSYAEKPGYLDRRMGNSGISLLLVDGGTLENVTITNIAMSGVVVPLFLRLGNRARLFKENMEQPAMGSFRDVFISNVTARDVGELGCSITGLPGHNIENVTLSNIRIAFPGGGTAVDAAREMPELAAEYPAAAMFGRLPAWGFYCRHVSGLRLNQLDLHVVDNDERPALAFEDVKQLDLNGVSVVGNTFSRGPVVLMRDVRGAVATGCRVSPASGTFLRLEGQSENVSAVANHLFNVRSPFEFAEDVSREILYEAANGRP